MPDRSNQIIAWIAPSRARTTQKGWEIMTPEYLAYLDSPTWAKKRQEALERAGHKCQLCASIGQLQVHHNTYKRLGNELPTDLCVLCRNCHIRHHPDKIRKAQEERAKNTQLSEIQHGSKQCVCCQKIRINKRFGRDPLICRRCLKMIKKVNQFKATRPDLCPNLK